MNTRTRGGRATFLRTAVEIADRAGASTVCREHVGREQEELESGRARQVVWDLPTHEEAVLSALCVASVKGRQSFTSQEVYEAYAAQCDFWRLPRKGRWRFLDFL